jgi:hypothetical protein
METKIRSEIIDMYEEQNIYLDQNNNIRPTFQKKPIRDLMGDQYNNSIIFYNESSMDYENNIYIKNDLFDELT